MEEDINILEQFLYGNKLTCENCEEKCNECYIEYEEVQAVARLIKGYRELEKENEKLIYELQEKEHEIKCANRDIKVFETEFIPKSKIKEKIEELEKYRDLAKEDIEERVIIADSDSLNYGRAEAHDKDIQVLQELMEDK